MNRRSFLIAVSLSSGGFLVGCSNSARQQMRDVALPLVNGQVALNGWVKVSPDGTATAVMARSEMGQGSHTGLMMLVAEELDCGWGNMRFEQSVVDPLYGNVAGLAEGVPFRPDDTGSIARTARWAMSGLMRQMGFMMTGGSSSIRDLWIPMREAAAVTRATLVEAAARSWSVAPGEVKLSEGVFSGPGGKTMNFGDAVRLLGANPKPAENFTLKQPGQFKLIGKPVPRNDSLTKTEGTAQFGLDITRPGMLYAAVRMAPVRGGTVKSFDGSKARALPGVIGVVSFEPANGGSGGVAVVADRYWRARKALDAVEASFDDGAMGTVSSALIGDNLARSLDHDDGHTFWKVGDVPAALSAGVKKLDAEYRAPYLAHATMEPMNCTVEFRGDGATVWAPTQGPGFARRAAAKALGLKDDQVELNVTYLGGGFGRRIEVDSVAQAAAIAKNFPGKAVQTLWSREDDTRHDFYRPYCVSRFNAALDSKGGIVAWRNVSASQAITPQFLPRTVGMPAGGPDKTTSEGAFDIAYEFPAVSVGHVAADLPVPVGYWRSVGHSHQAFFTESFLDECAHAAGADPLKYRLALLANHPRQRAVLELAAAKAGWGQALDNAPDGAKKAHGIALHESFGSIAAHVAEVSLGPDKRIRVHRVVCAIDCGFPLNPNLIAQQTESCVVYGLSAAIYGNIDIESGRVKQGNFHDYQVVRMVECPQIETHIVQSVEPPEGVGEPGLPPLAPAVANAVFALTGQRLRSLPLKLAA
jgi:isoquinoline 1-oxidoreductase beta subunit